jgi:hypothetical protein
MKHALRFVTEQAEDLRVITHCSWVRLENAWEVKNIF